MRSLLAELPITPSTGAEEIARVGRGVASWWLSDCHGILYNLALIIPTLLFVVYLGSQARRSYARLTYGRSHIMIAYYALLWLVTIFNLLWCLLQTWQCTSGKEFSWNMLSLITNSGLLFLEISLIAFMIQGNNASGVETLTRTFVVSGVIICADLLLKVIYVFGFGLPLFIDSSHSRVKWGLWTVHKLLLTSVYGFILFMHHSKWRERLPARPAFYNYICAMLLLNAVSLFGCVLLGNGAGFGLWLYNLATVCYHSLYLPLLYVTFLADFFQEEDLRLENVYYSEMKDAGFFDADWD
ncbi:Transmembrane protein adipocyte-associated 1 [Rhynchospora pubera]|uniref:Transmembrane protein adipocyte-associated 1 n=1 Tax=Rhynchospora pubera TaxID=906938 RepID=A0AAV8HBG9_9POAL|nr:Transmembrane protein adipocyte-associated 1 [Rhynchospora pubera]KAJ4812558.1 Transmembrane protein adipocyte-associated 1 [Rhynchospora pubera]